MRDPDAWIAKPQPTPETCRLFHGVDCRRCVSGFKLLDRMVAIQQHHIADEWSRDHEERQRRMAEFERKHAPPPVVAVGREGE